VIRSVVYLLLVGAAWGQTEALDPSFAKIPFERWLSERESSTIRWTAGVSRPELSFHLRLATKVEVKVDGRDLETRRGDGRLVFLVQITGRDGARYQEHGSIELARLDEKIKSANLEYAQSAFVIPGEYKLAVALFDTGTGEHSVRQSEFRVTPPQRDLLPGAWRDLPAVEFIPTDEPPEGWYLPRAQGRLRWTAPEAGPARLNVILNVALSEADPWSRRSQSSGMAALLPALKALAHAGSEGVVEHVEVLDLARRRATFQQEKVAELDWPRLKAALGDANPAAIDIQSLSERHHSAQYLVSSVRRVMRASEESCVVVILTPPVAFETGEDLSPVSLEALPSCRVIYIRYRGPPRPPVLPLDPMLAGRRRGMRSGPMTREEPRHYVSDQLANTMKPLNPKVFDVETPEELARAMAEVQKAILRPTAQ
jgi:hypothetical protein